MIQGNTNILDLLMGVDSPQSPPRGKSITNIDQAGAIDFGMLLARLFPVSPEAHTLDLATTLQNGNGGESLLNILGNPQAEGLACYAIPLADQSTSTKSENPRIFAIMTKEPESANPLIPESGFKAFNENGNLTAVQIYNAPAELHPIYPSSLISAQLINPHKSALPDFEHVAGELSNLIGLKDLAGLKSGEKLSLTIPPNDVQPTLELEIKSIGEPVITGRDNYPMFEITIKSSGKQVAGQAVLINNDKNAISLDTLVGLLDKDEMPSARLLVFVPEACIKENKQAPNYEFGNKLVTEIEGAIRTDRQSFINPNPFSVKDQHESTDGDNRPTMPRAFHLSRQIEPNNLFDEKDDNPAGIKSLPLLNSRNDAVIQLNGDRFLKLFETDTSHFKPILNQPTPMMDIPEVAGNANPQIPPEVTTAVEVREMPQFNQVEFKLELPKEGLKYPEGGYFRIRLEPQELGKVEVELEVMQNKFVARMQVDSPLAKQVIKANLPQLRDTLNSHGIKVESIIIDLSTGHQHQDYAGRQAEDGKRGWSGMAQGGEQSSLNAGLAINEYSGITRVANLRGNLSLLA